jgi:hypothetical protein
MLTWMGLGSDTDAASFTALNIAAPQEVGIYIDRETDGLTAMSQVLDSIGGYIVPDETGAFSVGRVALGDEVWEIDHIGRKDILGDEISLASNTDTAEGLPIHRMVLTYLKNWHTQTRVGNYLSTTRKTFLATEWREIKADAADVLIKHQLSPEMRIETLLTTEADALAEAQRRLALYSVDRDTITLSVRRSDAGPMVLGTSGRLAYSRHGYENGKTMMIIGRRDEPGTEQVQLTLWG